MSIGSILLAPSRYEDLRRFEQKSLRPDLFVPISTFGMPVHSSTAFPILRSCGDCAGSGSGGEASTYCEKCVGRGGERIEGIVLGGDKITLLTSPLPRKFEPSWPPDIKVPLRKLPERVAP